MTYCVFYDPVTASPIDIAIVRDGVSMGGYSGKTEEALKQEYPSLTIMDNESALKAQENHCITNPVEITEEQYDDALDALPPVNWRSGTFMFREFMVGTVTTIYAKLNGRYYKFHDRVSLSVDEINMKIKTHLLTEVTHS